MAPVQRAVVCGPARLAGQCDQAGPAQLDDSGLLRLKLFAAKI